MKRKTKLSFLLLVSVFLAFGNIYAQETAKEALDKGIEYLNKADYDRAISYFAKAIDVDSAYVTEFYRPKNSPKTIQAISGFTKAIDINPRNEHAYYVRGFIYSCNINLDQAISDFNKAIEFNPSFAQAYCYRGNAYLHKENLALMTKALKEKLWPSYDYKSKVNFNQAISDFNKAIGFNPSLTEAYNSLGGAYIDENDYDQAIASFNKAIELNPQSMIAYARRAVAYREKGNLDQAISDYTKAIEVKPDIAHLYEARADLYEKKSDYDKAWADVHKAEELGAKFIPGLEALKKASGREK